MTTLPSAVRSGDLATVRATAPHLDAPSPGTAPGALAALVELVRTGGVAVLTGAGISTDSGIPDYRGQTGRARPATPMTYQTFTGSPEARQRYWARSHLGWRRITDARPNDHHRAVVELARWGAVTGLVTQNVDGLHTAAGSVDPVELHGRLDRVICLACGTLSSRAELDGRLEAANPGFRLRAALAGELTGDRVRPDGDTVVSDELVASFVTVPCEGCGASALKPDVVFFGETVPRGRVDAAFALVDAARSLLVLGSSLTVMSGYRFVLHARRLGIPVAVVTHGPSRADGKADIRVDAPLAEVTPLLLGA